MSEEQLNLKKTQAKEYLDKQIKRYETALLYTNHSKRKHVLKARIKKAIGNLRLNEVPYVYVTIKGINK